ncbi:unnamed protein product [Lota lota]
MRQDAVDPRGGRVAHQDFLLRVRPERQQQAPGRIQNTAGSRTRVDPKNGRIQNSGGSKTRPDPHPMDRESRGAFKWS